MNIPANDPVLKGGIENFRVNSDFISKDDLIVLLGSSLQIPINHPELCNDKECFDKPHYNYNKAIFDIITKIQNNKK